MCSGVTQLSKQLIPALEVRGSNFESIHLRNYLMNMFTVNCRKDLYKEKR